MNPGAHPRSDRGEDSFSPESIDERVDGQRSVVGQGCRGGYLFECRNNAITVINGPFRVVSKEGVENLNNDRVDRGWKYKDVLQE